MKTAKILKESVVRNRIVFFFFIVLFTSPWLLVIVSNYQILLPLKVEFLSISKTFFIDEVNTLRGETIIYLPLLIARLIVNKYFLFLIEIFQRFFESFDPQFLFFKGDLDPTRSTYVGGVINIFLVIPVFYFLIKTKKPLKLILILLVANLFSVFFDNHYFMISRIGFFLVVGFIASQGINKLLKENKKVFYLFIFFYLIEFLRYFHDLVVHYPQRLSEYL